MLKIALLIWALWSLAFSASAVATAVQNKSALIVVLGMPAVGFGILTTAAVLLWLLL